MKIRGVYSIVVLCVLFGCTNKNVEIKSENANASMNQIQPVINIDSLISEAEQHNAEGDSAKAFRLYNQVLQENPKHEEALIQSSIYYYNKENYGSARNLLNTLARVNPTHELGYLYRGKNMLKQDKNPFACDVFKKGLALDGQFRDDFSEMLKAHCD